MDKVFSVELSGGNGRYCELELPATDYELLDALDKLRLAEGDTMSLEVCEYYAFEFLAPFLSDDPNLYELNALSRRLSDLTDIQRTSFAGLLKTEIEKRMETSSSPGSLILRIVQTAAMWLVRI